MIDIKKHYQELYAKHGTDVQSLQWTNQETQFNRFQHLIQPLEKSSSVVDIGCGFGDLYKFTREIGFTGQYLGLDFVDEFVNHAKSQFKQDQQASFKQLDIVNDSLPSGFDWYLASGIFNNEMNDNLSFLKESLIKMYNSCNIGISFNLLSTYVDYQDKGLFYADPNLIFDFCKKELSPKVNLNHSYQIKKDIIPFEYSVYVYR